MRFVYIDSQGTEVGIPSVEALQLRIELGAITEETMFYDQSADRWAPAGEHEVFRSVSREVVSLAEDRPEAAPSDSWGTPASASSEDPPMGVAADPFTFADDAEPEPPRSTEEVFTVETEGGEWPESDSQPLEDAAIGEVRTPESSAADLASDLDLEELGGLEVAPELVEEEIVPQDGWTEPGLSELPALTNDLELEPPLSAPDDFGAPSASDFGLDIARPEDAVGQSDQSFGFPADLETEVSPEASAVESAQEAGPHPFDDHLSDSELSSADGEDDEPRRGLRMGRDPYERRPRRPGSKSPPQRRRGGSKRRGNHTASLVVVAALGIVGVAGWFGVTRFLGGGEDVVVTIPDIPAELEAPMRELATTAFSQMLDSLGGLADRVGLPEEPNEDWLSGVYLANPDRYDDVLGYWQLLRAYLDQVREIDGQFFAGALQTAVSESGLDAEASDAVFARANAGFLAAGPARRRVYDLLEALIGASVDLHEFLLAHEGQIRYEPASGISAEPVTEAVAINARVNDEMWDHVLRITTALDALGTLERVTTERILQVFRRRLEMVAGS